MAPVTESTIRYPISTLFSLRNKNPIFEGQPCAEIKDYNSQSPLQIGMGI